MCKHFQLACVGIRFCCKLQQFCCSCNSTLNSVWQTPTIEIFPGGRCQRIPQGAIIRVLSYRRYANIKVWHFCLFSHVPCRYAILLLSAYLTFCLYHLTFPSPSYSKPSFSENMSMTWH